MGADYYPWQPREDRLVTEGPERSGIGEDSHVEGAIIDKNVSIGKRCRITNRDDVQEGESDNFYIREGIVVIPKNVSHPRRYDYLSDYPLSDCASRALRGRQRAASGPGVLPTLPRLLS